MVKNENSPLKKLKEKQKLGDVTRVEIVNETIKEMSGVEIF